MESWRLLGLFLNLWLRLHSSWNYFQSCSIRSSRRRTPSRMCYLILSLQSNLPLTTTKVDANYTQVVSFEKWSRHIYSLTENLLLHVILKLSIRVIPCCHWNFFVYIEWRDILTTPSVKWPLWKDVKNNENYETITPKRGRNCFREVFIMGLRLGKFWSYFGVLDI